MNYKLSCSLFGHSLDVRAVAVTPDGTIISGSRDKTAKVWKPNRHNCEYSEVQTLKGHTNFVSCVCVVPPFSAHPDGLILTGSNDHTICAFVVESQSPLFSLKGHTNTVCCLSGGQTAGQVLSASWDLTARLWCLEMKTCLVTFTGHQAAVWSVLQLPSRHVVTGSADKCIRVYAIDGTFQRSLTGHTDCVRGLAILSDSVFLSCANDATIRRWDASSGKCLDVMYGHKNYIYSLCVVGELIVSSGEDRSVCLWSDSEKQQLLLPAQSVWAVACLPNSDIVTGSSDGVVRVFSAEPLRQAEETVQLQFAAEVANLNRAAEQEIGGVKVSDLPGREVLFEPGRSDGQTKLVREAGGVNCYCWSAENGEWTKMGEVLGASGGTQATSGKTLYNGKEYDYVFSVDIEDGRPPLKLPFNNGDDPWRAAQEFIHRNDLSQAFLEQVANFIVTNAAKVNTPTVSAGVSAAQYSDPFTGGARYIPGGSSAVSNGDGSISPPSADPFTGATRYIPNGAAPAKPVAASTSAVHEKEVKLFPQTSFLRFDQANLKLIQEKLIELNRKIGDGLNQVTEGSIEEVVKLGNLDLQPSSAAIDTLKQLLEWPHEIVFPALDIGRLAVRHAKVNCALCSGPTGSQLVTLLRMHLLPHALPSNQMLALRLLANMFAHPPGAALVVRHSSFLMAVVTALATNEQVASKPLQIALVTVLLNLCVASRDQGMDKGAVATIRADSLDALVSVMPHLTEPEAQLRGLVALGTLLCCGGGDRPTLPPPLCHAITSMAANTHDPALAKVAHCSRQILDLIIV